MLHHKLHQKLDLILAMVVANLKETRKLRMDLKALEEVVTQERGDPNYLVDTTTTLNTGGQK